MKHDGFRDQYRNRSRRLQPLEWLLYVPGACIIAYGLWLSLTVTG